MQEERGGGVEMEVVIDYCYCYFWVLDDPLICSNDFESHNLYLEVLVRPLLRH